jgi:hypothetical protein
VRRTWCKALLEDLNRLPARKDYSALCLLVLMVLWFSHEMVWGGKVPFFRDLGTYFYPMRFSLAQSFKAGELPLWDRHIAMGYPLLANFQSGTFYPPHLIYFIFPFFTAIQVTFLFHYLVAATGAYALCRNWGYSSSLAMIGGIIFTLSGTTVSMTNVLNHFQTAVWLPWALLMWERCLRAQSWKHFLGFTLVLLLQFLAGSPELYAMSIGLLFLDGLRMRLGEKAVDYRSLFFLAAANALVVGLTMVQILPTAELFFESWRSQPISYGSGPAWSLHPLSLINLFFVDKQMNIESSVPPQFFFVADLPFFVSHYIGIIALVGLVFWIYYASLKERAVFLGLIIGSLLIAVGEHTPVYPFFFHYLPFFSLIRFPEKVFFLTQAFILFIALRGLFCFLESDDSFARRPISMVSSMWVLLLLLYLFLRLQPESLSRLIARTTHTSINASSTFENSAAVIANLEMQIALILGIVLLLFFRQRKKLRAPLFNALLIAMVFFDLNAANRPYQFLLNPEFVYKNPRVIASLDSEPGRLFYYPAPFNLHPTYYFFSKEPSLVEFEFLKFGNLLPNTGIFYGFDYMQEIDALGRWPYTIFLGSANQLPPDRLYRLLGELNIKYINSFRPLPMGGVTLVRYFPEYLSWLYKVDHVVPRAYIVSTTTQEKNPRKIVDRLASVDFDPFKQVILDEALPIASKTDFQAKANISRYSNRAVDIEAHLNGPGILVLADSYYPGWRAYMDGKEEKILRANLFFRAVKLDAGEHRVEFRYEPRSFRIGLAVSLATLLGLAAVSAVLRLKRK